MRRYLQSVLFVFLLISVNLNSQSVSIGGTVWLDTNDDMVFTMDQTITGATVALATPSLSYVQVTTTDGNGNYNFEGIQDGQYKIVIDHDNFLEGQVLYNFESCAGSQPVIPIVDNDDNGFYGPNQDLRIETDLITVMSQPGEIVIRNDVDFCLSPSIVPQESCDLAAGMIVCDLSDLDGFVGKMSSEISGGNQPFPLCPGQFNTAPHNISWIGFRAPEGDYRIEITPFSCVGTTSANEGVQIGVYTDCNFSEAIFCNGACNLNKVGIQANDLIPGEDYFIFIDGCNNSFCEFEISVQGGYTYDGLPTCISGDYTPFSNTTDWYHNVGSFGGFSEYWYTYENDTMIGGVEYQLIIDESFPIYLPLMLREDIAERKVYRYNRNTGEEDLLYDFSLQVGDVFNPPVGVTIDYVVDRIDTVYQDGNPLKIWQFRHPTSISFFYTEAVGGDHIDYATYLLISDPVFGISCAYNQCKPVLVSDDCFPHPRHEGFSVSENYNFCEGEIYDVSGYSQPGTYIDTLIAKINGCDSIVTVTIVEEPLIQEMLQIAICDGESYEGYEEAGIYLDTLTSVTGCDSIRQLDLNIIPTAMTFISETICDGEVYDIYFESGIYTYELTSQLTGCDSIITLDLTVLEPIFEMVGVNICEGEEYLGFTESGVYELDLVSTATGCDSSAALSLEVYPLIDITIDTAICEGLSFMGLEEEGTYEIMLDHFADCDTTLTINLEIIPLGDPLCTVATDDETLDVYIYPNPTSEVLYIESAEIITKISLVATSGQTIHHSPFLKGDRVSLDVSKYTSGFYVLKLESASRVAHEKIVVVN